MTSTINITSANVDALPSIAGLPDWDELLAPAPVGVAIVSQLLIYASQLKSDFAFVQHSDDKERFNVIRVPDSFRTTMWQIAKESYETFAKAHNIMENFLLQTDQVPGYAKDCVMYALNVNRENLKKLLGERLVKIKEAADDGARLTNQVCDAFDLLEQLINHVIEASSLTMSQIEKKRAFVDFEQLMKMEVKEKGGIKEDEKMQKGFDLCQLDIISDQNETLRKVLNDLGHLLAKCSSIHRFFNTIRNHFMKVTFPRLNEFTTVAGETLVDAYSSFLMGELNKSLKDLESCYKTHHSAAKLYVRVSDKHIMKSINLMHSMLSIPLSEVEGAQIKLMASCEEATKGIQDIYNEERAEATREIEKQNSSTMGNSELLSSLVSTCPPQSTNN
ncbi:uncharacterized protein LOC124207451 [Daphnia pulex]|uniref:uncharacterized protein LOC124207451 n=1 Tax=Daphnia pulex TaxID=6669 RepID=UPI001EE082B9|nr:uncharacterized protein LOC124207451 [Daphnia pulex]